MATITKVLRMTNKGDHALVSVLLEDGDEEYTVFVGGACETYFAYNRLNAFVKKSAHPIKHPTKGK